MSSNYRYKPDTRRQVTEIIIHCADTPNGRPDTADAIQSWHTQPPPLGNGWARAMVYDPTTADCCIDIETGEDETWYAPRG